ncbi:MAG TPA: carbon monoxide dehydrogenase subunit G [Conexivisphaerales archaeon]|nr:carbon monoxide dehydrogenase subunit G [Conexivisphaerales archaeon]
MQIKGSFVVPSNKDVTWDFISTPEKIVTCLPGLQESSIEGNTIKARIKAGVGFIKGTFAVVCVIAENDKVNHHAKLLISGSGAASSFNADVLIDMNPATTSGSEIAYNAEAKVSGPLGSLAAPMVEGAAKKMVDQIFTCVQSKLS